jgi:hypothetical protein
VAQIGSGKSTPTNPVFTARELLKDAKPASMLYAIETSDPVKLVGNPSTPSRGRPLGLPFRSHPGVSDAAAQKPSVMPVDAKDQLIVAGLRLHIQAEAYVEALEALVSFFKVGIELQLSEGMSPIRYLTSKRKKDFLDLKYFDTPETVERAERRAASKRAISDVGNKLLIVTPGIRPGASRNRTRKGLSPREKRSCRAPTTPSWAGISPPTHRLVKPLKALFARCKRPLRASSD